MEDRLSRMRLMVGKKALKRLQQAHVLVAGCGAVGGYVAEALARAGIGHLTIVDNDVVSITNINRQLVALYSTLGQKKVEVMKKRVLDIAPDIQIDVMDILINANSVKTILSTHPDFVVDAIDSLNPKVCLIEALVQAGIPFVSSMGAAMKTRPELVEVARMQDSQQCPLAAFVRKRLRRRKIPLDFPVVYSPERPDKSCLNLPDENPQMSGRVRHEMGSLPTLTGIFGLTCAQVVLPFLFVNLMKYYSGNDKIDFNIIYRDLLAQFDEKYPEYDINSLNVLERIYIKEINNNKKGIWKYCFDNNETEYQNRLSEFLNLKTEDKQEHFKALNLYLTREIHKRILIVFDNADQLSDQIQEQVYLNACALNKQSKFGVIISLREGYYYNWRNRTPFNAFDSNAYHIAAPNYGEVLQKSPQSEKSPHLLRLQQHVPAHRQLRLVHRAPLPHA